MKLIRVKKGDARPSMRTKISGNLFVEVYKDSKGYFYKIDIPGSTSFVSKERFKDQREAHNKGLAHSKRFVNKVKGDRDQTKTDDKKSFNWMIGRLKEAAHLNFKAAFILEDLQPRDKFLTPEEKTEFAQSVMNFEKVLTQAAEGYEKLRKAVRNWK